MESPERYHAKTFRGLEKVLGEELVSLGAENVEVVNRGVNFSGGRALLYRANFSLLTAIRILVPLKRFRAASDQDLYRQIQKIDWSEYFGLKNSFSVDAVVFSRDFRNSHYVAQKTKDAIVDQFRSHTHLRPSVDIRQPDIRINIHISEQHVTVSLDSSGESLHKRGYRVKSHRASMNEVLAAGIIKLTGWQNGLFLNPMCGAGTIAVEALLHATKIPPGVFGRTYGFEKWKDFDADLYARVVEHSRTIEPEGLKIVASDIDPEALSMTRRNIREAKLSEFIDVEKIDFSNYPLQQEPATLVINPPYGERLTPADLEELYTSIGASLKHRFPGSSAWLFTSNMEAARFIGLRPGKKITLFNANLECRLMRYDIFEGKLKEQ